MRLNYGENGPRGILWGRTLENGMWWAHVSARRAIVERGRVYLALGRFRFRQTWGGEE